MALNGRKIWLSLWTQKADGSTIGFLGWQNVLPPEIPEFQRFSITAKLPADCALIHPVLASTGGQVWWDAIQLERNDRPTGYTKGWGYLEQKQERRNAAHQYARAIIDLSRLRDEIDQLARLETYMRHAGLDAAKTRSILDNVRRDCRSLETALQTSAEIPAFADFAYDDIQNGLLKASQKAKQARSEAVRLLAGKADWFKPAEPAQAPPSPISTDKHELLDRFIVFPTITSNVDSLYDDEGDWEMLRILVSRPFAP